MKSMYHMVWCKNQTGLENLSSYRKNYHESTWWKARYALRAHEIDGYIHTFLIARKPTKDRSIYEIGVSYLRGAT